MNNKILGGSGERVALRHLKWRFYKIIAVNHSNVLGEIDIIARKGDTIVFVEVKTRKGDGYGTPAEAVTYNKRRRIVRMAKGYMPRHPKCTARFDVIEVYIQGNKKKINHIIGAFVEE